MPKILLIIPYFGRWPFWFDLFLHTCRFNPTVNWLLIGDAEIPQDAPSNVAFKRVTYEAYLEYVSDRLGIQFKPTRPYKLCDLKPMYGFLHEEELKKFDFWGFCDLDVVFGDLRHFLNDELLAHDVISCHATRISGHFALLRNTPVLREAFRMVEGWSDRVCDQKNHQLDEKAFSKLFIRYKNYPAWLRPFLPGFNRLGVRCSFIERYSTPDCRIAWEDGSRNFPSEWYWRDGRLTNNASDNSYMYFHFLYWKQNFWKQDYKKEGGHLLSGGAQTFEATPDCTFFKIDQNGFYQNDSQFIGS